MTAYRVVLRHVGDGERLAAWHGDRPWSYPEARAALIGVERLWPRLHNPGVPFYLAAEPMWPSREAHVAAFVAALLES
jgi:hypothetical protein